MIKIKTLYDLVVHQINFQKRLGNTLPDKIVTFENINESLAHNNYENIEFQEFSEAITEEDKKEEFIDYLLFFINKYIYLNIDLSKLAIDLNDILWVTKSPQSLHICNEYARLEQSDYFTFIRNHCTFKPWKVRKNESCVDEENLQTESFKKSLFYFRNIAEILFDDYEDFIKSLVSKMSVNIDRQNSGY